MNNSLVRIIYCSALVSATGVANAQFNFSASPTDTERFSLLQHDQRLNESGHFGATTLPRIPSSYDHNALGLFCNCLLYTSDAADERSSVDLGGRRIIKKKKIIKMARRRFDKTQRHNN